jgi:hypothetical protein
MQLFGKGRMGFNSHLSLYYIFKPATNGIG